MSPEKFLFCTDMLGSIGWPSPAPRLHINDCFEIENLTGAAIAAAVAKLLKNTILHIAFFLCILFQEKCARVEETKWCLLSHSVSVKRDWK